MELLNKYSWTIFIAVSAITLLLYIVQTVRVTKLMRRYQKFMEGKDATTLADSIEESFIKIHELELKYDDMSKQVTETMANIKSTFHKLGIVKYDAFKEMGGEMSFALCLLDDRNSGFILNIMHGRESSYTYIKEIIKGESYSSLGVEEKEALTRAKANDDNNYNITLKVEEKPAKKKKKSYRLERDEDDYE